MLGEDRVQAHHPHQLQHVGKPDVCRVVVQLDNGRLCTAVGNGQIEVHPTGARRPGGGFVVVTERGAVVLKAVAIGAAGVVVEKLVVLVIAGSFSALTTTIRLASEQKQYRARYGIYLYLEVKIPLLSKCGATPFLRIRRFPRLTIFFLQL